MRYCFHFTPPTRRVCYGPQSHLKWNIGDDGGEKVHTMDSCSFCRELETISNPEFNLFLAFYLQPNIIGYFIFILLNIHFWSHPHLGAVVSIDWEKKKGALRSLLSHLFNIQIDFHDSQKWGRFWYKLIGTWQKCSWYATDINSSDQWGVTAAECWLGCHHMWNTQRASSVSWRGESLESRDWSPR